MLNQLITWGLVAMAFKMAAITWWGVPASVFEPDLPPERQEVQSESVQ